ncbi:MAG TPA: hypothetical protein VI279_06450 [Rhodocyclaceae bacterium]
MTKRNRKTLAESFADGEMPTQRSFTDLIDSMVNIVDDGFDKTAVDGMKVAQLDNNSKLISFYDDITVREPLWSISFSTPSYGVETATAKNLNFLYGDLSYGGFTLARSASSQEDKPGKVNVGINKRNPERELDVGGVVAADGRMGRAGKNPVRADGQWHPIIEGLDGCQAFEIMAGVGRKNTGRYALLHAFALNTFNSPKSTVDSRQARFSSRCDQIDLRWTGDTHNYALEMRTRCSYEQGGDTPVYVRYYISQLWFDPFMDGSVEDAPSS